MSLEFAADGVGRSYLSRQFASYPFHICKAQYLDPAEPDLATLYVQSCSGGIYEGDDLRLELIARRNASVHVTTQASTIVHKMPHDEASQTADILAEDGAYLEFLPDPQILFAGSKLTSTIRVKVAGTATVVLCDALLVHDPSGLNGVPHQYRSLISIENEGGRQLAADRLTLAGDAFSHPRPGVLGRYGAQGTMLVITRDPKASLIQTRLRGLDTDLSQSVMGITLLPNEAGYLCRILAHDGVSLRRSMMTLWRIVRHTLKGHHPAIRRK